MGQPPGRDDPDGALLAATAHMGAAQSASSAPSHQSPGGPARLQAIAACPGSPFLSTVDGTGRSAGVARRCRPSGSAGGGSASSWRATHRREASVVSSSPIAPTSTGPPRANWHGLTVWSSTLFIPSCRSPCCWVVAATPIRGRLRQARPEVPVLGARPWHECSGQKRSGTVTASASDPAPPKNGLWPVPGPPLANAR